ncbi:MAG: hypothetical protein A2Y53_05640 [Chloroflexi bacterium RBG_16_47_49]|nr:MAG: hypothetical protein A2Y53_05640 [Chloroflexi bacterium RBG_16_47_49]
MGNLLICAPNFIEDTVDVATLGGGNWENSYPVSNLGAEFFVDNTISIDATTTSTKWEVDFGYNRDLKFIGIPDSNVSQNATIRVEGSATSAWEGLLINGVNSIGVTTLNIKAGATAVTIAAGQIFTIAGDTEVYQVVTGTSLSATVTGSIVIKRDTNGTPTGLVVATVGNEVVTCHSGDYTTPVFDTTAEDYFQATIPVGTATWGSSGVWDGKPGDGFYTRMNFPRQYVKILASVYLIQYVRLSIVDTGNAAGYITLDALYLTSVYQPFYNMRYGVTFSSRSNTSQESSAGGATAFNTERQTRAISLELGDIPVEEAFSSIFDITRQLDISGNLFIIYDDEDTFLLTRRSFAARFENSPVLTTTFFDGVDVPINIIERLA